MSSLSCILAAYGDVKLVKFVWPHGGREVFVTGPWVSWSPTALPLTQVDGLFELKTAIVFEAYVEYKFIVDGSWTIDSDALTSVEVNSVRNNVLVYDPTHPPSRRFSLRAMSYNIRFENPNDGKHVWSKRRDFLCSHILLYRPDVIAMQEVTFSQLQHLARTLPSFDAYAVGRDDGAKCGEMCPIFVHKDSFRITSSGTFWLSDTPSVPASATWGNCLPRICSWVRATSARTARELFIFSAHLDHEVPQARVLGVALIRRMVAHIARGAPFVILGDFNDDERSDMYAEATRRDGVGAGVFLKDCRTSAMRRVHDVGTFTGFVEPAGGSDYGAAASRIDFAFVPHGCDVDVELLGVGVDTMGFLRGSDHRPIIVDLSFN